jgi:hypothetical protein
LFFHNVLLHSALYWPDARQHFEKTSLCSRQQEAAEPRSGAGAGAFAAVAKCALGISFPAMNLSRVDRGSVSR